MDLNATKKDRGPQRSSSPFAPDSQRHASFRDALVEKPARKPTTVFQSAAANTVQSRISPLIMEKFQDLAKSYEEEWHEKDVAETEGLLPADARPIRADQVPSHQRRKGPFDEGYEQARREVAERPTMEHRALH